MMERSDKHEVYISENSGLTGIVNPVLRRNICQSTDGPVQFSGEYLDNLSLTSDNSNVDNMKISLPYNTVLLGQECMAMSISMRLIPKSVPSHERIDLTNTSFIPQDLLQRDKKGGKTGKFKKKATEFKIQQNSRNDEKYINKMKDNEITIRNLSKLVTEEECNTIASKYGMVYKVTIINTYGNQECDIVYTKPESAKNARDELDGRIIDGYAISVTIKGETSGYGDYGGYDTGKRAYGDSSIYPGYTQYGAYVPESPDYAPPKSPDYAPPKSPVYEPKSPVYEPKSPVYEPKSPVYEPKSPVYEPKSPVYEPKSPVYEPKSPVYEPKSPEYNPYGAIAPDYVPPKSPVYEPKSPVYEPKSPVYEPYGGNITSTVFEPKTPPLPPVPKHQAPDPESPVYNPYGADMLSPAYNPNALPEVPDNEAGKPMEHRDNTPQNPGILKEAPSQAEEAPSQAEEAPQSLKSMSGGGGDLNIESLDLDIDNIFG
jgi:hypothetical protein